MKTVILCGGMGTRIRDVSENLPKPMLPIGDRPILWHIMKGYAVHKQTDFILCLGYLGRAIKDFFLNYGTFTNDITVTLGAGRKIEHHGDHDESGWRITLADTGQSTMTGGRISRVRDYIGTDEHFMLTYGDGVSDVDISKLIDFHLSHDKVLTVSGVRPPGRFGEIEADDMGVVTEFNEKPQATGGRISGGFFVCRRQLLDYLSDDDDLVFEEEPMRTIVAENQLALYRHDGFWQCMDTYRDYKLLNDLWDRNEAPWRNW